ncbi:MAG: phage capsid protein [Pseudomonadota bacterium]
MATEASNWYSTEYFADVIRRYQSTGFRLRGTVKKPRKIVANKAIYRKGGMAQAVPLKRGGQGSPQNPDRQNIEVDLTAYQVQIWEYEEDIHKMNASERDEISFEGSSALGRKTDDLIIDVMDAATGLAEVGSYADPFDLSTALEGCRILQREMKMWDSNVYCPLPSNAWNQMLTHEQFTSADYMGADLPFTKTTDRRSWNGVHWFLFPDDQLPLANNTERDFFMYHHDAVGCAEAQNVRGKITWENKETAWLHNMWMDLGETVLQEQGIIRFKCKDDAPITL